MNALRILCGRAVADERGLETVEYAIITGLIVAAAIGVLAAIGAWVYGVYASVVEKVSPPPQ